MKLWRILAKYCSTEGKVESFFKNQIGKINNFTMNNIRHVIFFLIRDLISLNAWKRSSCQGILWNKSEIIFV